MSVKPEKLCEDLCSAGDGASNNREMKLGNPVAKMSGKRRTKTHISGISLQSPWPEIIWREMPEPWRRRHWPPCGGLGPNQHTLSWSMGAHSRERVFTLSTGGTQIYMLIVLWLEHGIKGGACFLGNITRSREVYIEVLNKQPSSFDLPSWAKPALKLGRISKAPLLVSYFPLCKECFHPCPTPAPSFSSQGLEESCIIWWFSCGLIPYQKDCDPTLLYHSLWNPFGHKGFLPGPPVDLNSSWSLGISKCPICS